MILNKIWEYMTLQNLTKEQIVKNQKTMWIVFGIFILSCLIVVLPIMTIDNYWKNKYYEIKENPSYEKFDYAHYPITEWVVKERYCSLNISNCEEVELWGNRERSFESKLAVVGLHYYFSCVDFCKDLNGLNSWDEEFNSICASPCDDISNEIDIFLVANKTQSEWYSEFTSLEESDL